MKQKTYLGNTQHNLNATDIFYVFFILKSFVPSVEQRLKETPPRDSPIWGSIPYTVTKPRHYCGCQEVHADRSLIFLSPERLCPSLTNTEENACSQALN